MSEWILPNDLYPHKGIPFVEVLRRGPSGFQRQSMEEKAQWVFQLVPDGKELQVYQGNKTSGRSAEPRRDTLTLAASFVNSLNLVDFVAKKKSQCDLEEGEGHAESASFSSFGSNSKAHPHQVDKPSGRPETGIGLKRG